MLKTFTLKYGVMEPPPVDVQRARARRLRAKNIRHVEYDVAYVLGGDPRVRLDHRLRRMPVRADAARAL